MSEIHHAPRPSHVLRPVLAGALALALAPAAYAHVKWFAQFDLSDEPAALAQILTPTFFALAVLSLVVIGALVVLDDRVRRARWFGRLDAFLRAHADRSLLVLRVAAGATMLLNWQADALLAPELVAAPVLGWAQFGVALLLLFARTTPLAGAGLALLYGVAVMQNGLFHMLDYVHYLGVAWYFLVAQVREARLRETRIPALYLTVGFALCWLALEKIVYPQWTLYLLSQNPFLTLGFDADFFRVAAAFVEFALGYLLIICLFERPLAVVVTLVFFGTTLVFGKVEVIGHTLIHGALVVFLLEGPGHFYRPPALLHRGMPLRVAFATVNYALLLAAITALYYATAWHQHAAH